MGVQILNKDVSIISSVLNKPKASISSIFGIGGWSGGGGGPASQGPLAPASAVSTYSPIGGSPPPWNNLTNFISSDAYTTTSLPGYQGGNLDAVSNYLEVKNFGFSIPTSATINGIVVTLYRNADDSGIYDYNAAIIKNDVIGSEDKSNPNEWLFSGAPNEQVTYGGSSDLWGETWSVSDINSNKFGFALSAINLYGNKFPLNCRVQIVRITVHYTT